MPQCNDILYTELNAGSGIVTRGDTQSAVRRLRCDWADARTLALAMHGWTTDGTTWTQGRADQHPGEDMWVTDTRISPLGRPLGVNRWKAAIIDVTYKPGIFIAPEAKDFQDESLEFSGEMVDLGSEQWSFDGSTEPVGRPISKLVPMIAYNVTQYHVGTIPLSTMYSLIGTLNNATFKGATAGKMLYLGASAQRKIIGTIGSTTYLDWTIQHKFLYSNRDLNTEWRTSTGAFEKVVGASSVTKFTSGDFSLLNLG